MQAQETALVSIACVNFDGALQPTQMTTAPKILIALMEGSRDHASRNGMVDRCSNAGG